MTAINNALSPSVAAEQLPVQTHLSLCTRISAIVLALLAIIPLTIMVGIAFIASQIGDCSCTEELQKMVDKVHAIAIEHNLSYAAYEDNLCYTKNMPTRGAIWNEEDVQLAGQWVEQLELKSTPNLRDGLREGICLGASVSIVKEVQSGAIQNEAELIAVIAKYREGFSVESAALQIAYNVVAEDYRSQLQDLFSLKEQATNDQERDEIGDTIIRAFDKPPDLRRLTKVLPLVGLELDSRSAIEEKGCYCISSGVHFVALLNLDFGTYIVDPNYGLSPWDAAHQKAYKEFTAVYSFKNRV